MVGSKVNLSETEVNLCKAVTLFLSQTIGLCACLSLKDSLTKQSL